MNERIKELALELVEQCDWNPPHEPTYYTFAAEDLEKFAELIVQECIDNILDSTMEYCKREHIVEELKEHFGIKQ